MLTNKIPCKKTALTSMLFIALCGNAQAADLKSAVEKTIAQNPEVRFSFHQFRQAAEEKGVGRAGFLPVIDVNYTWGREDSTYPSRLAGTNGSYNRDGWSAYLTQNLFQGLQTTNLVRQLKYGERARYFEFLNTSEQQALEAARAYLDVLRYRALVDLSKENYASHKGVYEQIQQKVGAGVGRRVDLELATGRLALSESNLLTETSNLHDVSQRYERLTGELPPEQMDSVASLKDRMPKSEELMQYAVAGSPSYRSALENVQAVRSEVNMRKGAFSPTLDLRASASDINNLDNYDGRTKKNVIELVMNMNVFRGGLDNTNLKMAAERLNAALDLRDKSCRDLRQTTAIAYHDTVKLTEQIQYLREHQRTSEMVRDAYQRQFDIGQRTLLDLLDSENELFDANRALENAQQDLLLAEMRVLASSGKLLETLQLKPVETLKVEDDLDPETLKACATQYVLPARLDKTAIPARTYVPISQIDMQNIQGMNMQPQPGMPAPQQPMPARTMPATK
ncbi:TolC family outer membrane protein [Laribacter hongkongensis]|uniref:Putative agglutination protein n=1 Tax=Laribacter hongkongensis TaxID=168471 RepID=A0A248LHY2_9NEIS|nr:TolC family outer membrane protein [Laribacter hongkongensis]ASJ24242.1 putative agglutination protein [Laribacter hongkongensis]MCG9032618.1 TolC family outer membrane protein [Laribacter hongkongensis]MCG9040196.1 TolC family outer membrane protein [Laribacter hongkongensis]MCG9067660.1 TolC family outer membrane protein [Laribacter hongkongensis]MCG9088610.1 TolC family outer membrane protein [Laribacter hongkongensis]